MPRKVAIVGTGPRGLAVLEQIALALGSTPCSLELTVIDDVEVGAGRIWRTNQGREFLMNTVAGQVTMYSGPADRGPWRPGAGPTLCEWLQQSGDPSWRAIGANGFAPRYVYGHYLKDVYSTVIAALTPVAAVRAYEGRVSSLRRSGDRFVLALEDGRTISDLDSVVLATGHARATTAAWEQDLVEFARGRSGVDYIRADSAADLPLERIRPGSRAGIIGMGLGFYDIVGALTLGRGGVFVEDRGCLRYEPSGAEPILVAGSRSGLPVLARGQNQKTSGVAYQAAFFTQAAVAAARSRSLDATGSSALDFRADVFPLIQAEMEHVYYSCHVRLRSGEEGAASFREAHRAARKPGQSIDQPLLRQFGVDDVVPLDLRELARPFQRASFSSQEDFRRALTDLLRLDLKEACRGNVESPLKAALDVLRDVRDTIRSTIEHGGLTAESMQIDFLGDFAPVGSLLSAGPPAFRVEQLLALIEAGIVEIAGPDVQFVCDADSDRFSIHSPSVRGARWLVDTLVDGRVPVPGFSNTDSSLFRALEQHGLARSYRGAPGDPLSREVDGGLEVTRSPFQVVGQSGRVVPGLYATGIPTEKPRWFTQVGSATPGTVSRFQMDARSIAESVLGSRVSSTLAEMPMDATL